MATAAAAWAGALCEPEWLAWAACSGAPHSVPPFASLTAAAAATAGSAAAPPSAGGVGASAAAA
eukprot:5773710-Lingulodinium_polyedra.AAC.1